MTFTQTNNGVESVNNSIGDAGGWTLDLPTAVGFYWLKEPLKYPVVVIISEGWKRLVVTHPRDPRAVSVEGMSPAEFDKGSRWFGPLQPPEFVVEKRKGRMR